MLINLTPHDVTVRTDAGDVVFPKSGLVARVEMMSTPCPPLSVGDLTVPLVRVEYGHAALPSDDDLLTAAGGKPIDGYIVSTLFADAYTSQAGCEVLFVPDSGPTAIRENGQIVAVRALIRR